MSMLGDLLKIIFPNGLQSVVDSMADAETRTVKLFGDNIKRRLDIWDNVTRSNQRAREDYELKEKIDECRQLLTEYTKMADMYIQVCQTPAPNDYEEISDDLTERQMEEYTVYDCMDFTVRNRKTFFKIIKYKQEKLQEKMQKVHEKINEYKQS